MLEFLKDKKISQEVIDEIINANYDAMLYNLQMNESEIVKIIDYFTEIGIKVINELLIDASGVFMNDLDYIKEKFEKNDISDLVSKINDDYMYIMEIL